MLRSTSGDVPLDKTANRDEEMAEGEYGEVIPLLKRVLEGGFLKN